MVYTFEEATAQAESIKADLNLSDEQTSLLKLAYLTADGFSTDHAQECLKLPLDKIGVLINEMTSKGLLEVFRSGSSLLFKGVSKEEREKTTGMTLEENLVYRQIQESGNEGVWIKVINMKTNLHNLVVTRCLKSLESKNIIKAVRSVKNPTRKVYMLWDNTPSEEVTGGPWYSEQQLDEPFVKVMYEQCFKAILRLSVPSDLSSSKKMGACFSTSYDRYPTAKQVTDNIALMQISNEPLTQQDITTILNLLVFDGKVVRLLGGRVTKPLRQVSKQAKIDDEDLDAEYSDECTQYKAVVSRIEEEEAFEIDPLLDIPCDGCAVSHLCYPSIHLGISEFTQFKEWSKS